MFTNDEEVITQETDTETTENTEAEAEVATDEAPAEDVDALKKKLATAEAQKEHWRKKATEKKEEPTAPEKMSTADIVALSKVHEDDIERVERYAKAEGISIREALKNDEMKAILALREEQRTTANAANTTNTRRATASLSEEALIKNASQGKLPDSDEDIDRLIAAKSKKK